MKKQKVILWRILAILLMISLFVGNTQGAVYAAEIENLQEQENLLPGLSDQEQQLE